MPFEAIVDVSLAEERAKQLVDDAQAEAKRIVAEAETFSKADQEKAALKAKDEVDEMISRTEAKAAEEIEKSIVLPKPRLRYSTPEPTSESQARRLWS